jgi:hypothetical protein
MTISRAHILSEIRRLAVASGRSPGVRLFERETGIRESDWYPSLWLRWGDAIEEAGLARNKMVQAVENDTLLEKYALLARRLSRLPLQGELILESKRSSSFPSEKSFRRFGGKAGLIAAVAAFCEGRPDYSDVLAFCAQATPIAQKSLDDNTSSSLSIGYVYLMQHGTRREYKIGRTKNTMRREGEIGIELPHGVKPLHVIATDDPAGIENYWHRRFADKRLNGEWFSLSSDDVRAFKKWKRIA